MQTMISTTRTAILAALAATLSTTAVSRADANMTCLMNAAGPIRTAGNGWIYTTGGRPDKVQDQLIECGQPQAWAWRIEALETAAAEGVAAIVPLWNNRERQPQAAVTVATPSRLTLKLLGDLGQRQLKVLAQNHRAGQTELRVLKAADLSTKTWRTITIDLHEAAPELTQFTDLRLELVGEGAAWIAVQRIDASGVTLPESAQCPTADPKRTLRRCLWVWRTREIIASESNLQELMAFCKTWAITDLFVQVHVDYKADPPAFQMAAPMRHFLKLAHEHKLRVHAMDGAPEYVLAKNHARMFALVDAVHAFNQASDEDARFIAIHLDNEPYVMKAWKDPAQQPQIIADFMTLQRELHQRVNAAGMEYGVDIPFWYDSLDNDGQPRFLVDTPEGKRPLLDELFKVIDNAGIMSYRVQMTGTNGPLAHCQREFELGAKNDVEVYAALEVGTGEDVDNGISLGVYPMSYTRAQIDTIWQALKFEPGCSGLALHYYGGFQMLEKK